MANNKQKRKGFLERIWPTISDKESARDAIVYGFGWYIFSIAVTTVIGLWSLVTDETILGRDSWCLVDAAFLAVIAWRLWKNSRVWAVIGLAFESMEIIYKLTNHQGEFGIIAILIFLGSVASVRGAFAFHRYGAQEKTEKPAAPEENPAPIKVLAPEPSTMFVPDRLKANAFRVLRIASKSTLAEIHRAAGDMRRAALLGTIITSPEDVPALGEIPKSEADIRAAIGRIESPELRILDRLFWFHSDNSSAVERKTFIHHDLVLREIFEGFSDPIDAACIEKWSKVLGLWQQIVADDSYWAQICELELEGGFEPAAFPSEMEELRSKAVELACEPIVIAGREAVERNDTDLARRIIAALSAMGDSGNWAQSAQLEIVASPVKRFKDLCRSIGEDYRAKIVRENSAGQQNKAICTAELARFRNDVQSELAKLTLLLPPESEAYQEVHEEAALLLSAIASDFTWADEFIESEKLYEEALKLAENTYGAIRIQTALEGVRSSAQRQRATGKQISGAPALITWWGCGCSLYGNYDHDPATNSYTANYYFTLLYLPIFPISRYRVINAGNRRYQFLGKLPLRKSDRWHLGIGLSAVVVALAIAMASNSSSSGSNGPVTTPASYSSSDSSISPDSSSSSATPSTSSSSPSNSYSVDSSTAASPNTSVTSTSNDDELAELRRKIEAGRSEITEIENRLKPATDEASNIDERMKSLKSEMDDLRQQKELGTEIDSDHYNSLVDDYNSLLRRKKALFTQNESDLDRLDALQKEDDALMQQWKALGGRVE